MSVAPADFEEDLWTRSVCGCSVPGACCAQLVLARRQIDRLVRANRDQARVLAELTDECPPWAPSLAIVYWLWSKSRGSKKDWRLVCARIRPLISAMGELPAPLLTPMRWDEHRGQRRLEITKLGEPPRESTLNLELLYAKQMLSWAEENGIIKRSPLAAAKRVRTLSQRETRLRPEDIDRLLAVADDIVDRRRADGDDDGMRADLLKAFILCIHDSMMRFNEARNLRDDRIRAGGSAELLASETKGQRRFRVVPVTERTLDALAKIERPDGSHYIFAKRSGALWSETAIRAWFRRACELSGVDERATLRDKRVRPHDARAGGATTADEAGARATAIQAALGHASLEMTRRYLRSEDEENARHIAEIMQRATGGKRLGPRKPTRPARLKRRPPRATPRAPAPNANKKARA